MGDSGYLEISGATSALPFFASLMGARAEEGEVLVEVEDLAGAMGSGGCSGQPKTSLAFP